MFVHEMINGADPAHIDIDGDVEITYGQLAETIRRIRNLLYRQGVRKGDRVGLYCANRPGFIYTYMAVISLGAIIIPINNSLVDREVDFILKDSGSKLVVSDVPLTVSCRVIDLHDYDYEAKDGPLEEAPPFPSDLTEDDVCALVYTSGTTGSPKGAMLTHKNLISNVEQFTKQVIFMPEDKVLCVLPMFHCYGLTTVVHSSLYHHSTIVMLRSKSPSEIINTIVEHSVTIAIMVPPMYNLLARKGEPSVMETVHDFISGGASIPQPVAKAFYDRFGNPVREGYGLTEASPVVSVLPENKPKYLTSGPAVPGVEAMILTENGGPYVPGTVGELVVRGDNVMKGYWNREEDTRRAFTEDGWLRTGDQADLSDGGRIRIKGRIKEIIVTSVGEKVSPVDLEFAILEDPLFDQVMVVGENRPYVAALVVLNNERWRALCADLQVNPDDPSTRGSREVRNTILKRVRSATKFFPRYGQPRNVAVLPDNWTTENGLLTTTMKLRRRQIAERYAAEIEELYKGHGA